MESGRASVAAGDNRIAGVLAASRSAVFARDCGAVWSIIVFGISLEFLDHDAPQVGLKFAVLRYRERRGDTASA